MDEVNRPSVNTTATPKLISSAVPNTVTAAQLIQVIPMFGTARMLPRLR